VTAPADIDPAVAIPLPDAGRRRALRRMKAVAGGLLLLAAAVFALCRAFTDGKGAWGYLQAAAEASMIGGLADWFAVTALFRRPLRLPIPHTAIIPRKKDQIGAGLAEFVGQYFLTADIVAERLAAAHLPQRAGAWLAGQAHAAQVSAELSGAIGGLAEVLRDDELRTAVAGFADRRLREQDLAPVAARVLEAVCDSGQHQAALTALLRGSMRFLDENRAVFRQRLADESPEWVPDWVDDRVFAKGFSALQSFLADVSIQPDHELRGTYEAKLRELARALREDPEQIAKLERAKLQLLEHPRVREYLGTLWAGAKQWVLDGAADPQSQLRGGLEALVAHVGAALRDDPAVAAKADDVLARLAAHLATNYAGELAGIISTTVQRWDTAETSRRLELQVGRDLQFIRLNGTVVGALAGLLIYALSHLL
jgi:uncharacterized membrane-anchored protein YjiN (DUF445 family)